MRLMGGPFTGLVPLLADHALPDTAATIAKNCLMNSGELRPLNDTKFVWKLSKTGTIQTIWLYRERFWFHWTTDVDVILSPLDEDPHQRVYWTGEGAPKMSSKDVATVGSGTNYPLNSYTLGVPAPTSAPTITHGAPGDPTTVQARAYVYTYVSYYGEEGPPSQVSALHDITDGDSTVVSLPDTGPTGSYRIVSKNLYRLNEGLYQFVATVPVATTSYTDTTLNELLGDEITSTEYDGPPAGLKGLIMMPGGFAAGFIPGYVCLSEPYLPHAWPVRYRIPIFGGIVSIKAFNNSILVMTTNEKPYLITGNDPGNMYKEQFEVGYGSKSKRATVDMGLSIAYPCEDGIVIAGANIADIITKSVIDTRDWSNYTPTLAAKYGENYVWFTGSTGWVFNVKNGDLSQIDMTPTALYTDPGSGDLFMAVAGDVVQFDAGSALEMEWQSKEYQLAGPTNFSRARVRASSYPVKVTLYADGKELFTKHAPSKEPFTLPGGRLYDQFQYKIESKFNIKSVTIGNSVSEV